jgi:hypothetical protein
MRPRARASETARGTGFPPCICDAAQPVQRTAFPLCGGFAVFLFLRDFFSKPSFFFAASFPARRGRPNFRIRITNVHMRCIYAFFRRSAQK